MAKLGDIATYINGYAFKPSDWSDTGVPIIRIQDLTGNSYQANRYSGEYAKKYEVLPGDVLISWSASLGVYVWAGEKAVLNQHIFKVIPKNGFSLHYVYQTLSSYIVNFKRMAEARKTTMGHITQDHLKQSRIVIPPQDLINKFENIVKKIYVEITTVDEESQQLKYLRDFLLPMLMNGQVSIKD